MLIIKHKLGILMINPNAGYRPNHISYYLLTICPVEIYIFHSPGATGYLKYPTQGGCENTPPGRCAPGNFARMIALSV